MNSYMLTLCMAVIIVVSQSASAAEDKPDVVKAEAAVETTVASETKEAAAKVEAVEDKVMATVNGSPIMQSKIDEKIAPQLEMAKMRGQMPSEEQLDGFRKKVLQGVIRETLIKDKIADKKIKISDEEIDAKLDEIAAQQKLTREELIESAKGRGYDIEKIKEQVRMGAGFDKLMESESEKDAFKMSDEDAKKYYDENIAEYSSPDLVKVSHILAGGRGFDSFDEAKKAEAKTKIEEVQKKLKDGMAFEDAAKEFSDCPSSKDGGDLQVYISKDGKMDGKGRPGAMDVTFSEAAFTLKVGEYGEPVKTPFGYHIIKCTDMKKAEVKAFDDVKESIISSYADKKKSEFAQNYIAKLMDEAEIVYPEIEIKTEEAPAAGSIEIKPAESK